MGKGLAFLNLKFFHPGNKENQRRKWEALQREAERQRKLKERRLELNQEKTVHETRKMLFEQELGADSKEYQTELKREQIAWIYNAPPGLKKQIEKERKKVEEEKRLKEWQSAMADMTREERRFAEKEMETGLSVHERNVRRFEFLKNAPMAAEYVKNMEVTHKPFGKLIRNVRCIKCGEWGHRIYDRECEMNAYNPYNNKKEKKDKKVIKTEDKSEIMNDNKSDKSETETEENRHDPLYQMKGKLLNKHLERYGNGNGNGSECGKEMDLISMSVNTNRKAGMDTKSVFTLNPDESNSNARQFAVKNFEGNDGTQFELIGEDVRSESGSDKRGKKRKRQGNGSVCDEDYRFIMSLGKEKQRELLREIEKRERKRKAKKKAKKKKSKSKSKHRRYDSDSENERKSGRKSKHRRYRSHSRSLSSSRSRSRSRDRGRGTHKKRSHRR